MFLFSLFEFTICMKNKEAQRKELWLLNRLIDWVKKQAYRLLLLQYWTRTFQLPLVFMLISLDLVRMYMVCMHPFVCRALSCIHPESTQIIPLSTMDIENVRWHGFFSSYIPVGQSCASIGLKKRGVWRATQGTWLLPRWCGLNVLNHMQHSREVWALLSSYNWHMNTPWKPECQCPTAYRALTL